MSDQLNHMSGQFCSCSDILSEHLLLLIGNPATVSRYANRRPVLKPKIKTPGPYVAALAYYEAVLWVF